MSLSVPGLPRARQKQQRDLGAALAKQQKLTTADALAIKHAAATRSPRKGGVN